MLFLIDMQGLMFMGQVVKANNGRHPWFIAPYGPYQKYKPCWYCDVEWEANCSFIKEYLEWEAAWDTWYSRSLFWVGGDKPSAEPPNGGYYIVVCPD